MTPAITIATAKNAVVDQLRSGVRRPTTRLVRTPKPARKVTVPAEYASPAKSIGRIRKYETGLRTPPSRTAPRAMKRNVKAAQEVKNIMDQRVSTRRRPSSRKGPTDASRLSPLRITITLWCGPGVASE